MRVKGSLLHMLRGKRPANVPGVKHAHRPTNVPGVQHAHRPANVCDVLHVERPTNVCSGERAANAWRERERQGGRRESARDREVLVMHVKRGVGSGERERERERERINASMRLAVCGKAS